MSKQLAWISSLLILLLCWNMPAQAQAWTTYRQSRIQPPSNSLKIDSLTVLSGSVYFRNINGFWTKWPDSLVKGNDIFQYDEAGTDSIWIRWRVIGYDFERPRFNKDPRLRSDIQFARENPFLVSPERGSTDQLFDFRELEKQGSISRGLGLGNNQDLVLNSGFNLQLSGRLTDSIELLASMTDNNLPFQPDGFTQQLQDFDRVFVQIRSRKNSLMVGDYDLTRPDAYFLNFFKNVKGARVDNRVENLGKGTLRQTISLSAARGQFGRNVFLGREGNQGPYRLTGDNPGEFIVVLAGSERVYIDGELLQRGEQYDYIIDYNTADVVFTPNQIITNQSRIIVEFEYANQAYLRSIAYYGAIYSREKWDVRIHAYREGDSRNQPLFQDLTNDQKLFLSNLGDSVNQALFPSVVEAPFDGRQIRYKVVDSLGFSPVYVYSIHPDSARFAITFTLVGQGRGDYVPAVSTANGRVFEWVAPDILNGDTVRRGTHAPVIRLAAPNLTQLSTISARYRPDEHTEFEVEGARSANDQNLFSVLQQENNLGYAFKSKFRTRRPISGRENWRLLAGADFELLDANFRTIQPYRNMEFARDWNINSIYGLDREQLSTLELGLGYKDSAQILYRFTNYLIGSDYQGNRSRLEGSWLDKKSRVSLAYDVLGVNSKIFSGDYTRLKAELSRKFGRFEAGFGYELEDNLVYIPSTDTFAGNSFRFDIVNVLASWQSKKFDKVSFRYTFRDDQLPFGVTSLQGLQTGHSYTLSSDLNRWENQLLRFTATYRRLVLFDTPEQKGGSENNYLGQLEYDGSFFKKFIKIGTFYTFSQGQELRREIAYLEVPRGQGNYIWMDYNANGVQEIDEFEQAFYNDQANYIKVFIPGNVFVPTYANKFSQSLQLNPSALLGTKHWLGRFSNLTAMSVDRRNQGPDPVRYLNPFDLRLNDTSLVSANANIRNTLFFDRNNPNFGLDIGFSRNFQRMLLANGTETREQTERSLRLRWNILSRLNFENLLQAGNSILSADLFVVRNYKIVQYEWQPGLNWSANDKIRTSMRYAYRNKRNVDQSETNATTAESVYTQELTAELNYNLLASSSVRISLSNINNNFTGDPNSPAGFEMLQGLRPGNNQVWTATLFRKLANNLQLNFTYEGRAAENARSVHTGRVQARLVF